MSEGATMGRGVTGLGNNSAISIDRQAVNGRLIYARLIFFSFYIYMYIYILISYQLANLLMRIPILCYFVRRLNLAATWRQSLFSVIKLKFLLHDMPGKSVDTHTHTHTEREQRSQQLALP